MKTTSMSKAGKLLAAALSLILCLGLCVPALATGITVTATADQTAITASSETQTVTVTVTFSEAVSATGYSAFVSIPEGWSTANAKIKANIQNGEGTGTAAQITAGYANGKIAKTFGMEYGTDSDALPQLTGFTIAYTVPANADAGAQTVGLTTLKVNKEDGTSAISGVDATTTVTVSGSTPVTGSATFETTVSADTVPQGSNVTATLTLKTADALAAGTIQFAASNGTNSLTIPADGIVLNNNITGAQYEVSGKISFGNSSGTSPVTNLAADTVIATVTFATDTSTPVGTYTVGVTVPDGQNLTNAAGQTVTPDFGTPATFTVTKVLTGIAVSEAPSKTAYIVGDTFDAAGMVVTASYSDGTSAAVTGYTYEPTGALTASDTSVTVSYTEGGVTKTATQAITVSAVTLTGIEITAAPTKTIYYAGDPFDATGMVVTASYNNGTSAAVTGYTIEPSGALATTDTSVTVSYTEGGVTKTATQAITVSAVTLTGIEISTAPTKTTYYAGDTFDATGMVVTAHYNNGSSAAVTGYTVAPSGALATTNTSVTVSYTEGGVTKNATQVITVNAVALESIAITTAPTKTVYTAGDTFDAAGMVVTATYNNGSSTEVTGYTVAPSGALATTNTSVTVSYTEDGVTKTATQAITVNAAQTFTVSFDVQGHGTAPGDITGVTSGSKISAPTAPTDEHWTFGGWYKEAACSNAWNFDSDTVTANTTLYAKWTPTKGDLNGDGSVTIADAQVLFNFLVDKIDSVNTAQADVNGDNAVNSLDIVPLLNLISQLA